MTKDLDFTQGSISKKILLFSLPLMAGNIFQQLYNVVDTLIVGRFLGEAPLARLDYALRFDGIARKLRLDVRERKRERRTSTRPNAARENGPHRRRGWRRWHLRPLVVAGHQLPFRLRPSALSVETGDTWAA